MFHKIIQKHFPHRNTVNRFPARPKYIENFGTLEQVILKNTFVIENTGETQTLNCRLENLEVVTRAENSRRFWNSTKGKDAKQKMKKPHTKKSKEENEK